MKTITLIIEGMMCQNCRSHVDKALNGISGVAANVSLEEKKAVCTVEDGVSADTEGRRGRCGLHRHFGGISRAGG